MKKFRPVFCIMLAACLAFLPACGKTPGGEAGGAKGRFVETDITPPLDGRFASYMTADGKIVCYGEGLALRYESADNGQSWTTTPGPGSGTDRYAGVQSGTALDDGSLLVFIQGEGLAVVSPDGSHAPYPVDDIDNAIEEGGIIIFSLIEALPGDRLLLGYSVASGGMIQMAPIGGEEEPSQSTGETSPQGQEEGGGRSFSGSTSSFGGITSKALLYEISTGRLVAELQAESAAAAAADGTDLYILDVLGSVAVYSLLDGAPATGKPAISFGSSDGRITGISGGAISISGAAGGSALALGADGGMYSVQNGSLLLADSGGNISTVLESTAYSIGAPRNTVSSVHTLSDGSIVINVLANGQGNRLYRYSWDENATIDPSKTLTIWSMEDNSFVRAAIAEIRKKHPDASITYEIAMEGDTAVSASDAIKTLNTRLLNGSGPDVIVLDGCPLDSYISKGMLLELGALIDTGDIYQNLIGPFENGGKLYSIPTQFRMPALMGSAESLEKVQTLDALVELIVSGNDQPADGGFSAGDPFSGVPESERAEIYFENLGELCELFWLASAPAIVSGNKLDTDALSKFLEALRAISDKYGLANENSQRITMSAVFSDGGTTAMVPGSLMRYTSQMTNMGAFSAGNFALMQMTMDRIGLELAPLPGLTTGAWQPSTVVGVSADTKVAGFAAELIQAMLSPGIQQLNYGTGLPVTRAGANAQIEAISNQMVENGREPFTLDIESLIGRLSTPSLGDTALTDMMRSSIEKCCRGEISVEEAVKEIERNVKNYLAERE